MSRERARMPRLILVLLVLSVMWLAFAALDPGSANELVEWVVDLLQLT